MALTERLAILIDASSGGAVREFQKLAGAAGQADKSLTKTQVAGAALKGVFGAIGVTAVAAGMGRFAQASIEAASALEEAGSKAEVVFGDAFPQIEKFAQDTADALNLSERAAYDMTAAFAPMFKNAGFSADAVADLSTAMTAFVADFASFNNLSIEEAFTKIQSGLAGETEAVRRFGIDVSAAAVQSEAYAMGIAEVGDKLTEAQKIQARTSIILKDGADAMGDVARTADSYANQQRNLAENTEELRASFGKLISGEAADTVGFLSDLAEVTTKANDALSGSGGLIGSIESDLLGALSGVVPGMGQLVEQAQRLPEFFQAIGIGAGDAADGLEDTYTALYRTGEESLKAALNNESLADSADMVTEAAEAEQDAIDDLADAIENLGSKFRDADQAQDDLTGAIHDAREPFRDLKDAQDELAAATTDAERKSARQAVTAAKAALSVQGNSEAARDNRDRLRDLAQQTLETASAMVTLDGDTAGAAAETRRGRQAFIDIATQLDMTEREAGKYARQLGLIPKDVRSNVNLEGVAQAKADAKAVRDAVLSIPAYRQVEIVTKATRIIGESEGRASGGPVSAGKTYMVGEQGPELLRLQGANGVITPASRSQATQPAGNTYHVYGYPDDATLRAIRQREQIIALSRRVAA